MDLDTDFFKSPAHEAMFYLLELDGEERLKKLNVTAFHYHNAKYAKAWKERWEAVLNSLQAPHERMQKAKEALYEMYQKMLK